jgi:hypothetical protein
MALCFAQVYFGNEAKNKSHQKTMAKCVRPDGATAWRDALQKAIELPSGDGTEKMTKYVFVSFPPQLAHLSLTSASC